MQPAEGLRVGRRERPRRVGDVGARLRDRDIVEKLFDVLGPRYAKRNGGYLRILKTGFRKGDNAPLALVSLMDRAEKTEAPADEKKSEKLAKGAAKAAA